MPGAPSSFLFLVVHGKQSSIRLILAVAKMVQPPTVLFWQNSFCVCPSRQKATVVVSVLLRQPTAALTELMANEAAFQ